jgi:hypothetical protein
VWICTKHPEIALKADGGVASNLRLLATVHGGGIVVEPGYCDCLDLARKNVRSAFEAKDDELVALVAQSGVNSNKVVGMN